MGYPTDRIQLFDHDMNPLHEIVPSELSARVLREEINGEHSLTIETTRRLEIGWRALTVDGMGRWREWVVEETDELHDSGLCATGTYRLVWSLQYDMSHTYDDSGNLGHAEVGMNSQGDASNALALAIRGSKRWTVGSCDAAPVEAGKGVVMIAESAWDRISKVVAAWGGELDAIVEVGLFGVTARKVVLMSHLGSPVPTRRFEWGDDLTSIDRIPDPGPYFCRVVPIGKGETEYADGPSADPLDDEVSFEWPLSLLDDPEYFPYDVEWIQDDDAAAAFRVSDGRGGWEYPTKVVKYDKDDVELLYYEAVADLHNHTRPNVTYSADVAQFARAGMDVKGVALGDEVQCVDRGFNPDVGLAIQERVTAIEIDELNDYATTLTIGNSVQTLTSIISDITAKTDEAESVLSYYSTRKYLNDLLDRLNEELNVTGGYYYLVPGHGIFTYDAAVTDPLVGTEATQVVQIVGGGIRIASGRKANGEWDWRSVFTSGHIAADLVTAAKITAGYIGSASSGNYWNLDTGYFEMGGDTGINMGDGTEVRLGDLVEASITSVDVQYAEGTSSTVAPTEGWQTTCPTWREGYYVWTKTITTTTTGSSESNPVCISGRDGVSFNNATLMIYKRSASAPSVPSNNLTYSFDGGSLTGNMSGWSATIPSGSDPCWATTAVASSRTDTDTILPSEWATPALMFQVGENGINTAVVMLYQRASTQPSKPSGSFTYTFATSEISGSIGSWSRTIPSGMETCWVTAVTCAASTATDTFNGSEFSDPVELVKNGLNSATVYLYKRAASQPSAISSTFTYTFSTKTLSGSLNGWSTSMPTGDNPCWMVTATALSTSDTDTISSSEWSEPVKFVENGLNTTTVYLYKRSATQPTGSSAHPSSTLTYTFATNTLSPSPDNGWSLVIPSGTDTIWVIGSTALSTTGTDTIASSEWTTPTQLSGNDGVGITEVIEQYCLIANGSSPGSSTSWSATQPTWSNGNSIWTRSRITWTDSSVTYTTPVLATALTSANKAVYDLDKNLGSEGIFNRLMNNGRYQGLKRDPETGDLYINATYINSGTMSAKYIKGDTLKLGGSSNENGVLQVLNASGTEVCRLDNNGAKMVGEISMQTTCDIFDGSESTPGYYTATARLGTLYSEYANFIITNQYIAHERGCWPGLEISGTHKRSGNKESLMILPSLGGPHLIYSDEKAISISAGNDSAASSAGILVAKNGVRIDGTAGSYFRLAYESTDDEFISISAPKVSFMGGRSGSGSVEIGYFYANYAHMGPSFVIHSSSTTCHGSATIKGSLTVSGTKNRLVGTDNYSDRLLYCYETSSPLFGDFGSAVIGSDGMCVVSIDDVFSECTRTDMSYQVFLQKCGQGDLWVSQKSPTHFIVEGTENLAFDWHIVAHQTGYEFERLEDAVNRDDSSSMGDPDLDVVKVYDDDDMLDDENLNQYDMLYADDLSYIATIESLY